MPETIIKHIQTGIFTVSAADVAVVLFVTAANVVAAALLMIMVSLKIHLRNENDNICDVNNINIDKTQE